MATIIETPWVVSGGKIGELGYCTRCGEGLPNPPNQRLEIVVAMMEKFAELHVDCKESESQPETKPTSPWAWLDGLDTGVSSCTIFSAIMNYHSPYRSYDHPHDPDDFGRCYRLLQLFPDWKSKLGLVTKRFPYWAPFVREWDTMTALFEEESKNADRMAPKLYALMQELRKEAKPLKQGQSTWR